MPLPTVPIGPGDLSPQPEVVIDPTAPAISDLDEKVYQPLDVNTPIAEQRTLGPSRSFQGAFQSFKRQLIAQTNNQRAIFREEVELRLSNDESLATSVRELGVWFTSELGTTNAAIREERTIRAGADNANALLVDTVTANALGYESAVLMKMEAGVNPAGVTARYQMIASITAGGVLYKTGIYFDLLPSGGGFIGRVHIEANKFSIGTEGSSTIPFRIEGGVVYIENAVIKQLSIGTDKVSYNAITDYVITSPGGTVDDGVTIRSANIAVDNDAAVAVRLTGYQYRPSSSSGNYGTLQLVLLRNGSQITSLNTFYDDNFSQPIIIETIDQPGNGNQNYSGICYVLSGSGRVTVGQGVLSLGLTKR